MKIQADEKNKTAIVTDIFIEIPQDALDLLANVYYNYGCNNIIVDQSCLHQDFFDLSTGLAGEITQKYVIYQVQLAIVGDFSIYPSQALQDYMRESNQGKHIFFCDSIEDATKKLMQKSN